VHSADRRREGWAALRPIRKPHSLPPQGRLPYVITKRKPPVKGGFFLWPSTLILIPRQLLKLSVRVTLFYWSFVKQSSIVELQG